MLTAAARLIALLLVLAGCAEVGMRANPADWAAARARMVEEQLRGRGIEDARVLQAMAEIPRHEFLPARYRELAYSDQPVSIGGGQTISQPYVVALMTELLDLQGGERVLEIGTGSGYQAAVLSKLAREVYSIEIDPELAASAEQRLEQLGFENVRVRAGDGSYGWPEAAPFDAIIITAAAPRIPPRLAAQLREGGVLVLPLERTGRQELVVATKEAGELRLRSLGEVRFVPMTGAVLGGTPGHTPAAPQ